MSGISWFDQDRRDLDPDEAAADAPVTGATPGLAPAEVTGKSARVHTYLVTGEDDQRWDMWLPTATYANWIEGCRAKGRATAETWLVTCYDENSDLFLAAAKDAGVTVEEIEGAGDAETYKLLVGEPGSGWAQ